MTDTNTIPEDRIRIFNREGFPLAEFKAVIERSWAINEEGRARFKYSTRVSNIVNETVLQFGNWILIENSVLPSWVGVIDTPRGWGSREVEVSAYGPEHVFGQRYGPLEEKINGSAGSIFFRLLAMVNRPEATVIRPGDIWKNKHPMEVTVNPNPLLETLNDITERSGQEYAWRPIVSDKGRLVIFADWYHKQGLVTSAILQEGYGGGNIEAVGNVMAEDGEIINDVLAYGDGMAWTSKPSEIVRDRGSIGKYGLRQKSVSYTGVIDSATLKQNGSEYLRQNVEPARTFHLNALNVGDTFKYLGLGNVLSLQFQNVGFFGGSLGFQTQVRIVGMSYDPTEKKNMLELVVEEVIP